MKTKRTILLVLAASVLLMMACASGGDSGSAKGASKYCNFSGCEGEFKSLKGTFFEEIELEGEGDLALSINLSVESGPVRFWVKDSSGIETGATARPGEPAELKGKAAVALDTFKVYFEAIEGEASGIAYTIAY